MRDRLIDLILSADISLFGTDKPFAEVYADCLIENGVTVPPCKVGDRIYVVDKCLRKIIVRRVSEIRLTDWNEIYVCSGGFSYPSSLFNKIIFLTKEDAEKALKE